MKGLLFAFLAGAFITLQGVANSRISSSIGTWPAAALTQFTGFIAAWLIWLFIRDGNLKQLGRVQPLYLGGGALAAIIIFSNVTAIQHVGVTLSIAAVLIAQLCMTFLIDSTGWFGIEKKKCGCRSLSASR
ncbi:membrane protein [Paenibacillus macerans]|nr:membrane protein [Paenibacillus macerans]